MHGQKTSHLPIRYFLALLWAHPILDISTIKVNKRPMYSSPAQEDNTNLDFRWGIWIRMWSQKTMNLLQHTPIDIHMTEQCSLHGTVGCKQLC